MNILTPKQKIVLQAMKQFVAKNGQMPSVRDLLSEVKKLGLKIESTRSIFLYLKALEEKGFIEKEKKGKRKIKAIKKSGNIFMDVPILGAANAGTPTFFAEENFDGYIKVSRKIIGRRKVFAIQVSGDSMNLAEVGGRKIEDGDYVIIDKDYKKFANGDKVLAIIDGVATIKEFRKIDQNTIGLFPRSTNKDHRPIYLTPDDNFNFIINGKVVAVLKNFSAMENGK